MSDTVTLISKSPRKHDIALDHEVFRTREHGYQIRAVAFAGGDVRRASPGVLTLMPWQRVEGLHPAIGSLPQVQRLIAQREVAIETADNTSSRKVSPRGDTADPPQTESSRATLGRNRVRVEKGT